MRPASGLRVIIELLSNLSAARRGHILDVGTSEPAAERNPTTMSSPVCGLCSIETDTTIRYE